MQQQQIPEERLCLLLAQGQLSARARQEALALLAGPLQWDLVLETAREHEVYPLLYRNLKNLGFCGMPDAVRSELVALFRTNALYNSLFALEMAQILRALADAGIPVMPLKGLFLAQSLYKDINFRVCADMDILVLRENVMEAVDLLSAQGYQRKFPRWFLGDRRMQNSIECPLWKEKGSVSFLLELHWGVLYDTGREIENMKALWCDAQETEFLGVPVRSPSEEGLLLLLAAHAARHNWQGLKWLLDIHELCLQRELEWDRAIALARKFGWEQLLRRSLEVCHIVLDTPLPAGFLQQPPAGDGRRFPVAGPNPTPLRVLWIHLPLAKGPIEKLRFILRRVLIPTPNEAEWLDLPKSLSFLYYLVRPFRLVASLIATHPHG